MKQMTWVVETDEIYSREKSWVQAFDVDCNAHEIVENKIRTELRNPYMSSRAQPTPLSSTHLIHIPCMISPVFGGGDEPLHHTYS